MSKTRIALLVVGGIVVLGALAGGDKPEAEAPKATPTTELGPATTIEQPEPSTTTTAKPRPGSPDVYARIAELTDCAALQAEFDLADATRKRPGGVEGASWTQIGIAYMEAADSRMSDLGCY